MMLSFLRDLELQYFIHKNYDNTHSYYVLLVLCRKKPCFDAGYSGQAYVYYIHTCTPVLKNFTLENLC